MGKKYFSVTRRNPQKARQLEAGNSIVRLLNTVLFAALAGALILICVIYCLKPWQELCEMEEKLAKVEKKRDAAIAIRDQKARELHWILTDVAYFDLIVRDKLDVAHEGETIVRIDKETKKEESPKKPVKKDKPQ